MESYRTIEGSRVTSIAASPTTSQAVVVNADEVIELARLFGRALHVGLADYSNFHVGLLLFVIFGYC